MSAKKITLYDKSVCDTQDSWMIGPQMGERSANATIRPGVCDRSSDEKDGGSYIFKVVVFNDKQTIGNFNEEIRKQNLVARLGFTSPVYQAFIDRQNKIGMFVMDQYTITVGAFFELELKKEYPRLSLLKKIFRRCLEIENILKNKGILHLDPHFNNFMLEYVDERSLENKKNVKIIDFGKRQTGNIKTQEEITEESKLILAELKEFFGMHLKLEGFAITLSEIAEQYGFENIKDGMIDFFDMMKKRKIANKIYDDMEVRSKQFAKENGCDKDDLDNFYISLEQYIEDLKDGSEVEDPRDIDTYLLKKYKKAIQEVERQNNIKVSIFDKIKEK